ncbi:MAG: AAA family ATPase [Deltaproteobacteria bacterium]|nr:AAA family ATPase [Deltaproteobacteria bacterium]
MACPHCGADLIPGKPFCHSCGQSTAAPCPRCGEPTQPAFRFCPDCGLSLDGAEAASPAAAHPGALAASTGRPASPAAPVGVGTAEFENLARTLSFSEAPAHPGPAAERKQVTVLFCDLVGSTAIAERMDPEEYRDLLDGYLELALGGVHRMEGIVNQLAGDGFMALFGAPVSREDAPVNAVRAALEIQADLERYSRERAAPGGFALEARIGVHSGPVVVGTVGNEQRTDYTATGDTTNVAARLQAQARPGTILISAATDELTRGRFEVVPTGPIQVAGKRDPLEAFEVKGRLAAVSPMGLAKARGLTPLVGFEQELAVLEGCHERLLGNLPQMITVIGDAGSGKSRLVYEFKQKLLERGEIVIEARGSPLTRSVPFAPIGQILRQLFGVERDEAPQCACDKVAEQLGDDVSEEDFAALCQLITSAATIDVQPRPTILQDGLRQGALRSVVGLLERLSDDKPVTVIVEDLHWIDEASLELLQAALSTDRRRSAVMLIVTQRPDFKRTWHTTATVTQLQLLPLRDEDARCIVEARAGGALPAELDRRILDAADGNPFFLEEITRSLVEQGTLVNDDDEGVRLTRPVAEIAIPGTVQELIGARLDRLGPAAKRTAQVAAVLGRQFQVERLAELLDGESIDVPAELQRLDDLGILHQNSAGQDTDYRFGESLTQAVAYESLLMKERRQLHGRIAAQLEAGGRGTDAERAGLIAHHMARSEDRGKALESMLRAAQHAEDLPSYRSAMELYREAWKLAEEEIERDDSGPATRQALLAATAGLARVAVLYTSMDHDDIEQAALRGIEMAEELDAGYDLARLNSLYGMLIVNSHPDRFDEGIARIEKAIELAETHGTDLDRVGIQRALTWTFLLDGQLDRAARLIDEGIEKLRELGHADRLSDVYLSLMQFRSTTALSADNLELAMSAGREAHEAAMRAGNRTLQASTANAVARAHYMRGDYGEAAEWAARGLAMGQEIGSVNTVRSGATLQLASQLELGEKVRGSAFVEQVEMSLDAVAEFSRDGDLTVELLLRLGEQERAERYLNHAMGRAGGRYPEALDALARGHVSRGRGAGNWRDAASAYARARELAQQLHMASVETSALIGGAALALDKGQAGVAEMLLDRATGLAEKGGFGLYRDRAAQLRARLEDAGEGATAAAGT